MTISGHPGTVAVMRATALCLALLAAGCGGEAESGDPELIAFIEAKMIEGGIPGLAAARIEAGEVTWSRGFGLADLDSRRAVGVETAFLGASISKTIVSVLLMQLVESGSIDLSAPIDDRLGFAVRHPEHPDRIIDAKMLVTHSSGIIDDFIALGAATTTGDPPGRVVDFARGYLEPAHFGFEPGTAFEYSNAGFAFLGALIEQATGQPLWTLTGEKILAPLGMTDSAWRLSELDPERVAVPYGGTAEEGYVRGDHEAHGYYPATGFRTSARDLAAFAAALQRNGGGLVSAASAEALFRLQVPDLDPDQAFGFYFQQIAGRRWIGHTGSAVGASNALFFLPAEHLAVVVLTNSDAFVRGRFGRKEGSEAIYAILDRIRGP